MFEQMPPPSRPRVALVYGDAGHVGHLRDAVADHVEIVYETTAVDFDAARLAGSRATAALVNLDESCDWLDPIEARLNEAGVAVVFNDPDISRNLEGWAQARWLRHLTAKLSGSSDYDPPRPAVAATPRVDTAPATDVPVPVDLPPVDAIAITERPLSPTEIESMTANFVAVREPPELAANLDGMTAVDVPALETPAPETMASVPAVEGAETEPAAPATNPEMPEPADAPLPHAASGGSDDGEAVALDVDTEALSAMIDARLAESTALAPGEAPEVWRVVEGGDVPAVESAPAVPEHAAVLAQVADADMRTPAPSSPVDDADLLNALPSLGDWQLVDPDAPLAPAAGAKSEVRIEPTLSLDFADLELVPIEITSPVAQAHVEPIERWMHVSNDDKHVADKRRQADANGERA